MAGKRYNKVLKDFTKAGLDFRLNELGLKIEVTLDSEWVIMDEFVEAEVRTELRELDYGIQGKGKANRTATEEAWMMLSRHNKYNPIVAYFDRLRAQGYEVKKTDEGRAIPHLIQDFAINYFDNPDAMFPAWLFRWMVGTIAKVTLQERNPILVIGGAQDKGKSTWVKYMCPPELEEYHRESRVNPDSKDERLRLADVWIQEIPELGSSTTRTDVNAFKEHITKKTIMERPPYGGGPTRMNSICSFIATVNPDGAGFLVDTTGNSRFIVCEVNKLDFAYEKTDINSLWREAVWFYDHQHKAWELSPMEEKARDKMNEKYELISALDIVIDSFLHITHDSNDWLASIDIRSLFVPHYRIGSDAGFYRDLARQLTKRGLEKAREPFSKGSSQRQGWLGVKRRAETVDLNE